MKVEESFKKNVGDDELFPNHTDKDIWFSGYNQCQEDNDWTKNCECESSIGQTWCCNQCGLPYDTRKSDNKYTEEDMIKFAFDTYCYISGIMKVPFNQVSENITHAEDNLRVFINSLNKQDNDNI